MEMLLDQTAKNKKGYLTDRVSDKPIRSVVKSISWRILGTLDTILIAWFITGTLHVALSIGSIEWITKMILYFFHERTWNAIKWGKQ
jgi:uncharacterized membrane protein